MITFDDVCDKDNSDLFFKDPDNNYNVNSNSSKENEVSEDFSERSYISENSEDHDDEDKENRQIHQDSNGFLSIKVNNSKY